MTDVLVTNTNALHLSMRVCAELDMPVCGRHCNYIDETVIQMKLLVYRHELTVLLFHNDHPSAKIDCNFWECSILKCK